MRLTLALMSLCLTCSVFAEEIDFNFKDPKGVNMISFHLDSPLEPFGGFAYGVEGMLSFDPTNPSGLNGYLEVPAKNIVTPHPKMTEVLHGEDWIDVAKHTSVRFEIDEVLSVASREVGSWAINVKGDFTLKGVTKPLTVTLNLSHIVDGAPARGGAEVGDLLVLRTEFPIERAAFGIKPGQAVEKVAPTINVKVGITGYGI